MSPGMAWKTAWATGRPARSPSARGGHGHSGLVLGAEDRFGGDVAAGVGEIFVQVVLDGDVHVFRVEAEGEQALVQSGPAGRFGESAHAMGSQVVSSSPSELMERLRWPSQSASASGRSSRQWQPRVSCAVGGGGDGGWRR